MIKNPPTFLIPTLRRDDYKDWIEAFSRELRRELHDLWVEVGRGKFVQRLSDTGDYDFVIGDLTIDSDWHDLDLSDVIPRGAVAALLHVHGQANGAGYEIQLRQKGSTATYAVSDLHSQVANQLISANMTVGIDEARYAEYYIDDTPTWAEIDIVVLGWFI